MYQLFLIIACILNAQSYAFQVSDDNSSIIPVKDIWVNDIIPTIFYTAPAGKAQLRSVIHLRKVAKSFEPIVIEGLAKLIKEGKDNYLYEAVALLIQQAAPEDSYDLNFITTTIKKETLQVASIAFLIHMAKSNATAIELLISNNDPSVNKKGNWQAKVRWKTPLELLCKSNICHEKVMQTLITHGAAINAKDPKTGNQINGPLHMACKNKRDAKCIQLLLNAGADTNALDGKKNSPLLVTLQRYTDNSDTISEIKKICAFLLAKDPSLVNKNNYSGYYPIHVICHQRNFGDFANLLIQYGSAINEPYGTLSPLRHAENCNNVRALKALLEHNADINTIEGDGNLLHLLCSKFDNPVRSKESSLWLEVIDMVIKKRPDLMHKKHNNRYPIDMTTNPELIAKLMQAGSSERKNSLWENVLDLVYVFGRV